MPQHRPKHRRKPSKAKYTYTEEQILYFGQWAFLVGFIFLTIAAIMTTNTKLMIYSVIVGLFVGYGIYAKWFHP